MKHNVIFAVVLIPPTRQYLLTIWFTVCIVSEVNIDSKNKTSYIQCSIELLQLISLQLKKTKPHKYKITKIMKDIYWYINMLVLWLFCYNIFTGQTFFTNHRLRTSVFIIIIRNYFTLCDLNAIVKLNISFRKLSLKLYCFGWWWRRP